MALPDMFSKTETDKMIARIQQLHKDAPANWGKMNVGQMLAHCNVAYEMVYDNIHPKPSGLKKFFLKALVKSKVVSEEAYKPNGRTAPQFLINTDKEFEKEQQRLIEYLQKTQALGLTHFDQKESYSFGALQAHEWNNMFYKHLNHHLSQFGV